jgi:hypothetical protein
MAPSQFRALPESDRDLMLAHHEHVCPDCGNLRADCSDPDRPWFPQRSVCWATAAREVVARRLVAKHKQEPGEEPHPLDGVKVYVSAEDLSPDDDFI